MLKYLSFCVLSSLFGMVAHASENHCSVIKGQTYGIPQSGTPYSDYDTLSPLSDWKTLRLAAIDVCDGTQSS